MAKEKLRNLRNFNNSPAGRANNGEIVAKLNNKAKAFVEFLRKKDLAKKVEAETRQSDDSHLIAVVNDHNYNIDGLSERTVGVLKETFDKPTIGISKDAVMAAIIGASFLEHRQTAFTDVLWHKGKPFFADAKKGNLYSLLGAEVDHVVTYGYSKGDVIARLEWRMSMDDEDKFDEGLDFDDLSFVDDLFGDDLIEEK